MGSERIILIGAMGVGKTSVAKEIATRLNMAYIDIDALRWDFFAQQPDYDNEKVKEMFHSSNEIAAFAYFKPFEARFTVHVLQAFPNGVIDFGAGYTVYADEGLFSMVQSAFAACEHVILLRYSDDAAESFEALRARHPYIPEKLYNALNAEFIQSPCNELLATQVIDTKGLAVDDIVALILSRVRGEQGN